MGNLHNDQMRLLFEAILTLDTADECYSFFEDVCTIKELQAMAQRFQVACLLDAGKNYNDIYDSTGVSTATICRVNKCLQYGAGGYRTALERLKDRRKSENADGQQNSEK